MHLRRKRVYLAALLSVMVMVLLHMDYELAVSVLTEEDYERIIREEEAAVAGAGEDWDPTNLTAEERVVGDAYVKVEGMNVIISDKIGYRRRLTTDVRPEQCEGWQYGRLPAASVVIIFRDEPLSVLLRTIWSVLYTLKIQDPYDTGSDEQPGSWTYSHLHEVLLVDDASTRPELAGKLQHFVSTRLPGFVKIVRIKNNVGIVGARLEGARHATGEVVVFMDAHCEATRDWLRPLLQRLQLRPTIAAIPVVDVIKYSTFDYKPNVYSMMSGGFSFDGYFNWIPATESGKKRRPSDITPIRTPTMVGGIFAMWRRYFWEVGGYDDQMRGWGGENIEISFRLWMCGGGLEIVPCSHVGHVERLRSPYKLKHPGHAGKWINNKRRPLTFEEEQQELAHFYWMADVNTARTAEVWMDEYKEIFFLMRPHLRVSLFHNFHLFCNFFTKAAVVGDVQSRVSLRARLRCRSFHWYLRAVYPRKVVPVRDTVAFGRVFHVSTGQCMGDVTPQDKEPLVLARCLSSLFEFHNYMLTRTGRFLKDDDICVTATISSVGNKTQVYMKTCKKNSRQQRWRYAASRQLVHEASGRCLEARPDLPLRLALCTSARNQLWDFDFSQYKPFKPVDREQAKALARLAARYNETEREDRVKREFTESENEVEKDYDDVQPPK